MFKNQANLDVDVVVTNGFDKSSVLARHHLSVVGRRPNNKRAGMIFFGDTVHDMTSGKNAEGVFPFGVYRGSKNSHPGEKFPWDDYAKQLAAAGAMSAVTHDQMPDIVFEWSGAGLLG